VEPQTALPPQVLERRDVQQALRAHDFGSLFVLIRKWAGISFNRIGDACDIKSSRISQLARGDSSISSMAKIEQVADAFRIPGRMLRLAPRPWESPASSGTSGSPLGFRCLPLLEGASGEDYAHAIRETSRCLVALDNGLSALPVADLAARAFKSVHRRLGDGDYEPRYERDIRAAAAELAEVAGWALFDAEKHDAARRFNQEALFLARLSGDRSIELLILQNIAMQSGWLGLAREELAISQAVLEQGRLSPRVEAMFRAREAHGLAGSGRETDAARAFDHARSLLQDGERAGDPYWAWWVVPSGIDGLQALSLGDLGQWSASMPLLQRAMHREPGVDVGYRHIYAVRLLTAFLKMHAWRDAEDVGTQLAPEIADITSTRVLSLLRQVVHQGQTLPGTPGSLRDLLHHLHELAAEDPHTL
jgi:transcriptional regulator with XRE-family HTH domain